MSVAAPESDMQRRRRMCYDSTSDRRRRGSCRITRDLIILRMAYWHSPISSCPGPVKNIRSRIFPQVMFSVTSTLSTRNFHSAKFHSTDSSRPPQRHKCHKHGRPTRPGGRGGRINQPLLSFSKQFVISCQTLRRFLSQ
jgi:hypothetical protein